MRKGWRFKPLLLKFGDFLYVFVPRPPQIAAAIMMFIPWFIRKVNFLEFYEFSQ